MASDAPLAEPLGILQTRFPRRFRGYETAAVDRLLEDLAMTYEDIWLRHEAAVQELGELRRRLEEYVERENVIARTLVDARAFADQLAREAAGEAQHVLERARAHARDLVEGADCEQARLRRDIPRLRSVHEEIRRSIDGLAALAAEAGARDEIAISPAAAERARDEPRLGEAWRALSAPGREESGPHHEQVAPG